MQNKPCFSATWNRAWDGVRLCRPLFSLLLDILKCIPRSCLRKFSIFFWHWKDSIHKCFYAVFVRHYHNALSCGWTTFSIYSFKVDFQPTPVTGPLNSFGFRLEVRRCRVGHRDCGSPVSQKHSSHKSSLTVLCPLLLGQPIWTEGFFFPLLL